MNSVEKAFRDELKLLLRKYNADLSADDHYQGYAESGQDIRIEVFIPAVYEDNEVLHGDVTINLGRYVDGLEDS